MRCVIFGMVLAATFGGSALAQDKPAPSTIQVLAIGSVETPPEIATITYAVRGEGKTSDEATRALVVRKDAVAAAFASFADVKIEIRTGNLGIAEVRGKDCHGEDEDEDTPRLSTGACAVLGYVATMGVSARVSPIAQAGTLSGLAARAGASDVELSDFAIVDERAARHRAMAAAVASGTAQAKAVAAASGARLGKLIRVVDNDTQGAGYNEIVVTGSHGVPEALPVLVDISPQPTTTWARLTLTFEILQ